MPFTDLFTGKYNPLVQKKSEHNKEHNKKSKPIPEDYLPFKINRDYILDAIKDYTREELIDIYRGDSFLCNYLVNHWEFLTNQTKLTSYPWKLTIPVSDTCNASCPFCDSWIKGEKKIKLEELYNLTPLIKYAAEISIQGHGEPTAHPNFKAILDYLGENKDPRCLTNIITNGSLLYKYLDALEKLGLNVYNISLNAASSETHEALMDLGKNSFDIIISSIKKLIELRDSQTSKLYNNIQVNISMVVINQNIHEVVKFIELGNDLKVNQIYLRTLATVDSVQPGLNYHFLPPYLNPKFEYYIEETKKAISNSKVPVMGFPETWNTAIFPSEIDELVRKSLKDHSENRELLSLTKSNVNEEVKKIIKNSLKDAKEKDLGLGVIRKVNKTDKEYNEVRKRLIEFKKEYESEEGKKWRNMPEEYIYGRENPYNRKNPYFCEFLYFNLIWTNIDYIVPCCYMDFVPGHDFLKHNNFNNFFELWNHSSLVDLREKLKCGPMLRNCKLCPPQNQPENKN
jgi:wyosine [tRNA(Phe)-imidazoG37] synthetase (radical SAM superfamily)